MRGESGDSSLFFVSNCKKTLDFSFFSCKEEKNKLILQHGGLSVNALNYSKSPLDIIEIENKDIFFDLF